MNPSYMIYHRAILKASINLMMGIVPEPISKMDPEDGLTSTEFPRSDLVIEAEEAEARKDAAFKAGIHTGDT